MFDPNTTDGSRARPGHFSDRVRNRRPAARLGALLPLCLGSLVLSVAASGGTLRTLDGQTYEGLLKLESGGRVSVVPTKGPTPPPVPLADVLHADFRAPEPPREAAQPAASTPNRESDQLPAPWRGGAVGTLALPPYARFRDNTFNLKSAAADVGGTRDAFTFASQLVGDEADLVACLKDTANLQVVAGLTIRAGPGADAPHLSLLYFGDDIRIVRRSRAGRSNQGGPVGGRVNLPIWMRMTRRGDEIGLFLSKDGQAWESVGRATFTPPAEAEVAAGLAAFGRTDELAGAHFTNVRLSTAAPDRADAAVPAAAAAGAATIAPATPSLLKRGLMLRSGTLLAAADVSRADDGSVRYTKDGRGETVSLVNVARILFRDLTPQAAAKIPATGTGVLLREGDFVDGEFKELRDGQVSLSSVLFGLAKFDARAKVAALVLNDPEPARADAIVRTTDGSTYLAKALTVDGDRLVVEDPIAGPLTVARADVTEISIGPGRLEPLATRPPEKVEPADGSSFRPITADKNGTIGGRTLSIVAGGSATWTLDGQYRTLTLSCGVGQHVLPTAPVRFVVIADDKELYRSPPRTSLSAPTGTSLDVRGVKTLTLKVESTFPHLLPIAGYWFEPSLIR